MSKPEEIYVADETARPYDDRPAARRTERGRREEGLRELAPTLSQLGAAGVTTPESGITVESVEETVVLDPSTYRITSHTFKCGFRIPYDGQSIRYEQEVTERTEGPYDGTMARPEGIG